MKQCLDSFIIIVLLSWSFFPRVRVACMRDDGRLSDVRQLIGYVSAIITCTYVHRIETIINLLDQTTNLVDPTLLLYALV